MFLVARPMRIAGWYTAAALCTAACEIPDDDDPEYTPPTHDYAPQHTVGIKAHLEALRRDASKQGIVTFFDSIAVLNRTDIDKQVLQEVFLDIFDLGKDKVGDAKAAAAWLLTKGWVDANMPNAAGRCPADILVQTFLDRVGTLKHSGSEEAQDSIDECRTQSEEAQDSIDNCRTQSEKAQDSIDKYRVQFENLVTVLQGHELKELPKDRLRALVQTIEQRENTLKREKEDSIGSAGTSKETIIIFDQAVATYYQPAVDFLLQLGARRENFGVNFEWEML